MQNRTLIDTSLFVFALPDDTVLDSIQNHISRLRTKLTNPELNWSGNVLLSNKGSSVYTIYNVIKKQTVNTIQVPFSNLTINFVLCWKTNLFVLSDAKVTTGDIHVIDIISNRCRNIYSSTSYKRCCIILNDNSLLVASSRGLLLFDNQWNYTKTIYPEKQVRDVIQLRNGDIAALMGEITIWTKDFTLKAHFQPNLYRAANTISQVHDMLYLYHSRPVPNNSDSVNLVTKEQATIDESIAHFLTLSDGRVIMVTQQGEKYNFQVKNENTILDEFQCKIKARIIGKQEMVEIRPGVIAFQDNLRIVTLDVYNKQKCLRYMLPKDSYLKQFLT
jgi:hypothetical protein